MTRPEIVADIVTALARAEGVAPHELDYHIHDHIDTDAIGQLVAMDNDEWRLTATVATHEVTIDGTGRIRVDGDLQHVVEANQ